MDSCLTSCEGPQKEQEIQNSGIGLRPFNRHTFMERKEAVEAPVLRNSELKWCDEVKKNNFLNPFVKNVERRNYERSPSNLSMSIGLEAENENGSSINLFPERIIVGREEEGGFRERKANRTESRKLGDEKISQDYNRLPYFAAAPRLDLNKENEAATTGCKQLDLNGFSWS